MQRLGRAISILVAHERAVDEMHGDVRAFGAPSECHGVVSRYAARDFRLVRKHACAVAGVRNLRELRAACKAVVPRWDRHNHFKYGIGCL